MIGAQVLGIPRRCRQLGLKAQGCAGMGREAQSGHGTGPRAILAPHVEYHRCGLPRRRFGTESPGPKCDWPRGRWIRRIRERRKRGHQTTHSGFIRAMGSRVSRSFKTAPKQRIKVILQHPVSVAPSPRERSTLPLRGEDAPLYATEGRFRRRQRTNAPTKSAPPHHGRVPPGRPGAITAQEPSSVLHPSTQIESMLKV